MISKGPQTAKVSTTRAGADSAQALRTEAFSRAVSAGLVKSIRQNLGRTGHQSQGNRLALLQTDIAV